MTLCDEDTISSCVIWNTLHIWNTLLGVRTVKEVINEKKLLVDSESCVLAKKKEQGYEMWEQHGRRLDDRIWLFRTYRKNN